MRKFSECVDLRSRQQMTRFLLNHFRYDTMNSWNAATSYACNLKIYKLGLGSEIEGKLYDMLQVREFFDAQRELMDAFAEAHQFRWQVGMNGRSGGYLVLYEGGIKPTGHLSYCRSCYQRNFKNVTESGNVCGRCGKPDRVDYVTPPMQTFTYPGRGIDMDEDFAEWTLQELRDRVRLIQELDALADDMVQLAVEMARNYTVLEVEVQVPQTRSVLVPNCELPLRGA